MSNLTCTTNLGSTYETSYTMCQTSNRSVKNETSKCNYQIKLLVFVLRNKNCHLRSSEMFYYYLKKIKVESV